MAAVVRARIVGAAQVVAAFVIAVAGVVAPEPASAQRLVAATPAPAPFDLDTVLGPSDEAGGLVVFGADLYTREARSVRITATSVAAAGAGVDDRTQAVLGCAGTRWIVRATPEGQVVRTSVGPAGAPPVWSRLAANDLVARCVQGQVVVGWIEDGVLATQVISRGPTPARRTRVAEPGAYPRIGWASAALDEVAVVVEGSGDGATRLLRIAAGVVTHRRSLGQTTGARIAASDAGVLVATCALDGRRVVLRAFRRQDLRPGPSAAVLPTEVNPDRALAVGESHHALEVIGLWPGPGGRVAVAVGEGWSGPGFRAVPAPPDAPLRMEPERHHFATLRLWVPAAGRVGAPVDVGPAGAEAVAWLGDALVLVQGAYREDAGPIVGSVVRRFTVDR